MANSEAEKFLKQIEENRRNGVATVAPGPDFGSLVGGGKRAAFNEAVKKQGAASPKPPADDVNDSQSRLRKALDARNKK